MKKQFTMDDVQILHEDNCILVVNKPQNLPTQADASGDVDLNTLLKGYLKEKYGKQGEVYLGMVHRLDRPTGGVIVFAKNSKSAERLSEQIKSGDMEKTYFTTLVGCPKVPFGTVENYLRKNPLTNVVTVCTFSDEGAKHAELHYKVLESCHDVVSLVKIQLKTGRSHQIRVQMAGQGTPVFGDAKYGGDVLAKGHQLALWAVQLSFFHPVTKERMTFVSYPPETEPWTRFDVAKYLDVFRDSD